MGRRYAARISPTHYPVDDARGNAEAFLAMIDQFQIKVWL